MNKRGFVLGEDNNNNKDEKTKDHDDDRRKTNDSINRTNNRIFFYSEIDRDSVLRLITEMKTAENELLKEQIDLELDTPRPLYINIFSYGGEIFSAFAVCDAIRSSKIQVISVCEGAVMSAGTLISTACHKRYIKKNATFRIHSVRGGMWGKYQDIKDENTNMERLVNMMKEHYKKYTKIQKETMEGFLTRELDWSPKECLKYGFVDKIIE